jgi:hypothetical protein
MLRAVFSEFAGLERAENLHQNPKKIAIFFT